MENKTNIIKESINSYRNELTTLIKENFKRITKINDDFSLWVYTLNASLDKFSYYEVILSNHNLISPSKEKYYIRLNGKWSRKNGIILKEFSVEELLELNEELDKMNESSCIKV